jgi:hypothetical protein
MHSTLSMTRTTCANGEACLVYTQLGEPATLSRSNRGEICWACNERRLDEDLAASSCEPAPTRKRRRGTGSIAREQNGRWRAQFSTGRWGGAARSAGGRASR